MKAMLDQEDCDTNTDGLAPATDASSATLVLTSHPPNGTQKGSTWAFSRCRLTFSLAGGSVWTLSHELQ